MDTKKKCTSAVHFFLLGGGLGLVDGREVVQDAGDVLVGAEPGDFVARLLLDLLEEAHGGLEGARAADACDGVGEDVVVARLLFEDV